MQAVYKCTYNPGVLISDLKGPCPHTPLHHSLRIFMQKSEVLPFLRRELHLIENLSVF